MKEEFDVLFAEHQKLLGELQAMRGVKRTWVGLTDDDISKACGFAEHTSDSTRFALKAISRAVEAKLKEKNT